VALDGPRLRGGDHSAELTEDVNWNSEKGAYQMKRSTRNKAKGKFHELEGRVKEEAGKLTNNRALQVRGKVEKVAGKVQGKLGRVEKALGH